MDSKKHKPKNCEEWKIQFDNVLNYYVSDIVTKINNLKLTIHQREDISSNNYKKLLNIIKNTKYPKYLENVLKQLHENGNDECLEHILENYYVHYMRPAYNTYMTLLHEPGVDYHISCQIMLRLVRDRIFGQFQFGTKSRNVLPLLNNRETGLKVNSKIKKSINYDCIDSLEFLLNYVRNTSIEGINDLYNTTHYASNDIKEQIKQLDKHIKKILSPDCLEILLNMYPRFNEAIDEYDNLDFFQDNPVLLRILKRNL